MNIALIGCSKRKKKGRHKAKDLYQSVWFRYTLQYALRNFDTVYILSAKHGLLALNQRVNDYDETLNRMSRAERKRWAEKVALRLRRVSKNETEVCMLCGKQYGEFLPEFLPDLRFAFPLKGLKIGQQLQWYKNHF